MNTAVIAITLSCISLLISVSSFGWTIYKDTRYRANVRLKLSRKRIDNFGPKPVLEIFNDGPGAITLDFYIIDTRPLYKRLFSRHTHKDLILSKGTLDKKLNAGEVHHQLFDDWQFTGAFSYTLVGVADKFRNAYFVPKRQLWGVRREAKKEENRKLRKSK